MWGKAFFVKGRLPNIQEFKKIDSSLDVMIMIHVGKTGSDHLSLGLSFLKPRPP